MADVAVGTVEVAGEEVVALRHSRYPTVAVVTQVGHKTTEDQNPIMVMEITEHLQLEFLSE